MEKMLAKEWETLLRKLPAGEKLTAKHIPGDSSKKLYCAVDSKSKRHLMIKLNKEEKGLDDTKSRGVSVHIREIAIGGAEIDRYIDIECQDADGHSAFDLLISEISNLINSGVHPNISASRVLKKWRRFWSKTPRWVMSREAQIGLFAELKFLSEWIVSKLGAEATNSWCGPFGGRNDFKFEDFSVEVKATTSSEGRLHRINGLDQLSVIKRRKLFLFSMCMKEEMNGENLLEVIKNTRYALSGTPEALDHFEEGLMQVGYSDVHANEYKDLCLDVKEQNLFEVKDNFPRIDDELWRPPQGVGKIEYEVNLNTFDSLIIAREPSAWIL